MKKKLVKTCEKSAKMWRKFSPNLLGRCQVVPQNFSIQEIFRTIVIKISKKGGYLELIATFDFKNELYDSP